MSYIGLSDPSLPTGKLEWLTIDEDGQGIGGITADVSAEISPLALQRLYCLYIITRLNEESLREAHDCLHEIYTWQVQRTGVTLRGPTTRRIGPSKVKHMNRQPFVLRED